MAFSGVQMRLSLEWARCPGRLASEVAQAERKVCGRNACRVLMGREAPDNTDYESPSDDLTCARADLIFPGADSGKPCPLLSATAAGKRGVDSWSPCAIVSGVHGPNGYFPLRVSIDEQAREMRSDVSWTGDRLVMTISSSMAAPDSALRLISVYVGHPETHTIATHLVVGGSREPTGIHPVVHDHGDLDPLEQPTACAYDHARHLGELVSGELVSGELVSRLRNGMTVEVGAIVSE